VLPIASIVFDLCRDDDGDRGNGGSKDGMKLGETLLKDVRFADDQGMVACTQDGLQSIKDGLVRTAKDMKMEKRQTSCESHEKVEAK
jgi:hypothetical protein